MVAAWVSTVGAILLSVLIGTAVDRWLEKFEREPQWWPPFGE